MSTSEQFEDYDHQSIAYEALRHLREWVESVRRGFPPEDKVIIPKPPADSFLAGLIPHLR